MPDFFDATHSEFDGEVDWAADEATGIDTRAKMEYGKVYRRLDTAYCSSCGIGTVRRNDLVSILRRNCGTPLGHGWTMCPEHFAKWSGREELTEAEQQANHRNLFATVCPSCFTQRSASGACLCDWASHKCAEPKGESTADLHSRSTPSRPQTMRISSRARAPGAGHPIRARQHALAGSELGDRDADPGRAQTGTSRRPGAEFTR